MKQIRHSVFETNSSSTHSIAIPKECTPIDCIYFNFGQFGWAYKEVNPADYLYTAIYEISETEEMADEKINRLKEILDSHNIRYEFEKPKIQTWHCDENNKNYMSLSNGYIDHGDLLDSFVDALFEDEEKLIRFISRGLVFTGNDNDATSDSGFICRDSEYLIDYDFKNNKATKIKNPYYMENNEDYDWYGKGN